MKNKIYLTSKRCVYITEFKANITTSYNSYPIWNEFQLERMITGDYSLPCRQHSKGLSKPVSISARVRKERKEQDFEFYNTGANWFLIS